VVLRVARQVQVFPDLAAASDALAERLIALARPAVEARGRFRLAISGGRTPLGLYSSLAGPFRNRMPWASTSLFFADERCVSPRSEESNFGNAWRSFLSKVAIPRGQLHRMRGELRPIAEGARRYANMVGPLPNLEKGEDPLFDLVLLGIGPDGHTASLFPGLPAARERSRPVVAVPRAGQPPHVPRLTLTLPALSSARAVWFLVAGEDKVEALSQIFRPGRGRDPPPAALVHPPSPSVWFVDAAAARGIPAALRGT
jgi:6-phosphogluconolactonase